MEPAHPAPRDPSLDPLVDAWPITGGSEVRDQLIAAYADPARGYHDTLHLSEVLARVAELAAAGLRFEVLPVALAAWFHDAVYDGERDAEERSAAWAEEALPGLVEEGVVAEVGRLVRLTETHRPDDADANGCALSDADLGILAAPSERYAAYVAAVRTEYAHLDDATFTAGRHAVLSDLLDKPRLFQTSYAFEQWEAAARDNATAELSRLTTASA